MPQVTEEQVLDALRVVQDPDLHKDIVTLGFVKDIRICEGTIAFKIELTTPACPVKDLLKAQAEAVVTALPGAEIVQVEMTARVRGQERTGPLIPGVKNVIAVASGKGGVGKSTVSCNLAVALAQTGAKVGLLDADIYGPSIPMMMGAKEDPSFDGKMLYPVQTHGVLIMSIGFFLEDDKAVVWRGPMIGKALNQFLGEVNWGNLDYLIVDLPPGTGDAPMSLAQLIPLTGVVVVMTPQDVAQQIANKSILMFRMLEQTTARTIPILGVVENMSGFICPKCGEETDLFSKGGGESAALRLGVPFLGAVPLDPTICISGDAGQPALLMAPQSRQADSFRRIAGQIAARVSTINAEANDLMEEAAK
jgi:ATP-binding protein involved in chromosome partitioning